MRYPYYVMDFEHRDPREKKYLPARMIGSNHALESVKQELDKCDVVCANCHRERTHGKKFIHESSNLVGRHALNVENVGAIPTS